MIQENGQIFVKAMELNQFLELIDFTGKFNNIIFIMNIFLTGGSGFVGRSIISKISTRYNIHSPPSNELDLTNFTQLENLMNRANFDFIINCAVRGGRRTKVDIEKDFYNNIKILDNILYFVNKNTKLI